MFRLIVVALLLTAAFADNTESPHSAPYAFTPPMLESIQPPQIFKIVEIAK